MITKSEYRAETTAPNGEKRETTIPYVSVTFWNPVTNKPVEICVEHMSLLDQGKDLKAIVNAANTAMRGGGGIDGAIHKMAGTKLMDALLSAAPRGCDTGEVVVTPGFDTGFEYIFHTPGPVYKDGKSGEADLLSSCYWNCMNEANMRKLDKIGFCSISTGIYGYPLNDAAKVAVQTVLDYLASAIDDVGICNIDCVVFSMFTLAEYEAFSEVLKLIADPWVANRNVEYHRESLHWFVKVKNWFKSIFNPQPDEIVQWNDYEERELLLKNKG